MSGRTAPPAGAAPPERATTPAGEVDLAALADEVCRRYDLEFPDERQRYGPAGQAWCRHDNQHLLNWAIADVHHGLVDLLEQAGWLARVLAARDFPLERLARDLEICADVVAESGHGWAEDVAGRLRAATSAATAG